MAGNANSGRRAEKPFRDAIRMEVAALRDSDPKALRAIARKLLEKAAEGDMQAIKELADRMDGKASGYLDVAVTNKPVTSMTDEELIAIASAGQATDNPENIH